MITKRITVIFKKDWVLKKRSPEKMPVEAAIEAIKETLDIKVLDTSLTEFHFLLEGDDSPDHEIHDYILSVIAHHYREDENFLPGTAKCIVGEYFPPLDEDDEIIDLEEEREERAKEVKAKIDALVGAEEFKALADECVKVAPGLIRHGLREVFTHQCYLFAINDGDGLTTYLELFGELITALELMPSGSVRSVVEKKVTVPQEKDRRRDPFEDVYSVIRGIMGNGRIICIDISEWMTKITTPEFRHFLTTIEDHLGDSIYIFKVPFVEKEILDGLHKGIGDILTVREVSFVPFDQSELAECAEQSLTSRGFTIEKDAWEVFHARITEEKNDGRFYGINTVNKVIREMIYQKQLNNAQSEIDDTVVKKAEILNIVPSYNEQEKSGFEMLGELIGMETIRERVEEIVAQILMAAKNSNLGSPCIHMRFVGNPGTGKTTVARIIGKILKEKGILRNGNFFEHFGRDFCGRYIGETAPKTAAMCRDAYGSVLFIDEAYSLYRGEGHSKADFGREAIETLISEMENHRSDLVVIMAGYTDEMAELMKANAGLESRMPYVIEFPNYTREQLYEIFMLMVNKNFRYREGFTDAVKEYFNSLSDEVLSSKEFSNARFVRNLFERTWGKAVLRSQLNKEDASELIKEDFLLASSEKDFKKNMKKPSRTVGFIQ